MLLFQTDVHPETSTLPKNSLYSIDTEVREGLKSVLELVLRLIYYIDIGLLKAANKKIGPVPHNSSICKKLGKLRIKIVLKQGLRFI